MCTARERPFIKVRAMHRTSCSSPGLSLSRYSELQYQHLPAHLLGLGTLTWTQSICSLKVELPVNSAKILPASVQ